MQHRDADAGGLFAQHELKRAVRNAIEAMLAELMAVAPFYRHPRCSSDRPPLPLHPACLPAGQLQGVPTWHSILLCMTVAPLGLLSHALTKAAWSRA